MKGLHILLRSLIFFLTWLWSLMWNKRGNTRINMQQPAMHASAKCLKLKLQVFQIIKQKYTMNNDNIYKFDSIGGEFIYIYKALCVCVCPFVTLCLSPRGQTFLTHRRGGTNIYVGGGGGYDEMLLTRRWMWAKLTFLWAKRTFFSVKQASSPQELESLGARRVLNSIII